MSIKEEIKLEVLKRLEGGEKIKVLVNEYGISKSSIYQLRNDAIPKGVDNFNISVRDIYLLRKELETLRQTVKIYEKNQCVKTTPLSQKLVAMKRVHEDFSHKSLCKVLNVKKGTFLNHLYRKAETTQIQETDEVYKEKILNLYELTEGKLGSKKLTAILRNEGHDRSERRILRLMKELNLKCNRAVRANKVVIPRKGSNPEFKNLLKRDFYPKLPNRVWVSDFSQFNIDYKQKILYLCNN